MQKGAWLLRVMAGHMVAYPLALLAALAWIPIAIQRAVQSGFDLPGVLPTSTEGLIHVMKPVLLRLVWPAAVAFLTPHVACLPWAFASEANRRRYGSRFWLAVGTLGAAGVVAGVASWVWLWFFS